jgi:hypothetical protein
VAITIEWGTRIINVPKADLTLIQASPTEIRELDLDAFRLTLKGLEDDEEGMPHPDTHRHVTETTLGGVTYARVIEIINDYTVTFEDGQYAVNLVGANSNVGDVVNVNQVSVRSANSAGLISNPLIEYAAFNGGVTVDVLNGVAGTVGSSVNPIGTPKNPSNNMSDALLIAAYRGLTTFFILGDITLNGGLDYSDYIFIGESMTRSEITIDSAADVSNCEFFEALITGTLDGNSHIKNCRVADLNYVHGVIEQCLLEAGTITLGGSHPAIFLDCWSGNEDVDSGGRHFATIDCGGAGQSVVIRNYNGYISLKNKTGNDHICIDLNSGVLYLEDTITNGYIDVRGVGHVVDDSVGAVVNSDYLLSSDTISDAVHNAVVEGTITQKQATRLMMSVLAGKSTGGDTTNIKFRDTQDSKNRVNETVDEDGNRTSVTLDLD